jgi:hypothetical protein
MQKLNPGNAEGRAFLFEKLWLGKVFKMNAWPANAGTQYIKVAGFYAFML